LGKLLVEHGIAKPLRTSIKRALNFVAAAQRREAAGRAVR
jgi:hypothetical protein